MRGEVVTGQRGGSHLLQREEMRGEGMTGQRGAVNFHRGRR